MYPRRFSLAAPGALRADRYKLIEAPEMELYDLATDPTERRDIYAERPTVTAAMLQRLRSFDTTALPETVPGKGNVPAERLRHGNALGHTAGAVIVRV